MKAFKLIGAAVAASLLLLTSCLGESNNTVTRAGFGVAGLSEKTYKTVLNTNMGALYSPSLSAQVVDGACYLINYELDLNSPENANAATNGYLTATISVADEITKGQPVFYNVPDSASLLQNEIPVKNLFSNGDYGVYVDGYLFFFITMDMFKDQKNSYTLYWDRSKEPTMVDNVPTYDLFLRVAKVADGTGSAASSIGEVRAFNVKSVLESVNSAEANKDSKSFNLKVNYLNTINEKDSTDLKWASYTVLFQFVKNS